MPEIPIPERARNRHVRSGLAVPYITLEIDGRTLWGETHGRKVVDCIVNRLCQLCAQPLGEKFVFLLTEEQLAERFTREPPLHPECAAYAQRACPMIAGRMTHYAWIAREHTGKGCVEPGCGCGGWITHEDNGDNRGRPAEAWFAAWFTDYATGIRELHEELTIGDVTGCVLTGEPLKVRPVVADAPRSGD
ncbi:MAG TPA: hypothetical protein VGS97_20095 [Actinocrinis sp.]|uniref:hypothetical protein n=1 Tax=Actinocrinis sp. TaxID=1920516 RepID=UPI002DDCD655|nr:hypothetical protein [Actinocrinis sp.]HEV2346411.1 hypothetical protein [Actinocrinis sp.]